MSSEYVNTGIMVQTIYLGKPSELLNDITLLLTQHSVSHLQAAEKVFYVNWIYFEKQESSITISLQYKHKTDCEVNNTLTQTPANSYGCNLLMQNHRMR